MKYWTPEDIDYLETRWGEISIPVIAKNLGRTVNAVKLKAQRRNLGCHLHSGEEVTFLQLLEALGKRGNYTYYRRSWIKRGCPVKYKKSIQKRYMVIRIDDFWKWAEKNKNIIDFAAFEKNALGQEPAWVPMKRQADILAKSFKTTPWTIQENRQLASLLNQFCFGYKEISERLHRTEGAIKRRMIDLKIKQRPIRADNHTPWDEVDIQKVKSLFRLGYIPEVIARQVNRSGSAVRGLIERMEAKKMQA